MIHYIVTYATEVDSFFDFDYYQSTHLPMGEKLLGEFGLVRTTVERCLPDPSGNPPAFACVTRLYFEDQKRMRDGFAAHGERLRDDIVNYTNVTPVFTLAKTL